MRRALGPFLATGVALVAATVVVANPVAPPSRDMQISTTQLSTSPDLLSPSDKSLLSALTPQLPVSNLGPALAQILAALAADADRISREVSPEVPLAAALPEQAAYRPEPMAVPFAESPSAAVATAGVSTEAVTSDVQEALNSLVADTYELRGTVVEAAYAVVDVIVNVPRFVVIAVVDLLRGDFAGALGTVKSAVKAFVGPGVILLNGIRAILYGHFPPLIPPPMAASRLVAQAIGPHTDQPATGDTPRTSRDSKANSTRPHGRASSAAALRPTGTASKSPAASDQTTTTFKTPSNKSSKPTTGSARTAAGSARDSKSSASPDSSTD